MIKIKTHADDPAFKTEVSNIKDAGLTKREYFASMALQGFLADVVEISRYEYEFTGAHLSYKDIAERSVIVADMLIEELNKPRV